METSRGDAAAATWVFRGNELQRRRGCDVDSPWKRVAAPRRRGYSIETSARLRYELGGYWFAKRRMAHDFFSCETRPLPFDTAAIAGAVGAKSVDARTAFMLCHLIPSMNSFLAEYQRGVCGRR